ncbi:hypothetical protein UFOVP623_18 [uncultured Caudovirales phage]|uniref:Uncharacterized protein n=1 Tax=uncultured Caudovirales phage TaxID=2100421 RepID=A0A6J5N870_9CAUD|nr:hypothetical protein UFOVP623_18 [uncultured Caudovirales phage]
MARITTNTTGTQPVIEITTLSGNTTQVLTVPFIQDITITNSTGVYAYNTFNSTDANKLSTPADNEITTNVVIDDTTFFGSNASAVIGTSGAAEIGIAKLSSGKVLIGFKVFMQGNTAGSTDRYYSGQGFFTSIASTTSPDAPVWVTPLTIAVDGAYTIAVNG